MPEPLSASQTLSGQVLMRGCVQRFIMRPPTNTSKIVSDRNVTEMGIVGVQNSSSMLTFFEGKCEEIKGSPTLSASRPLDYICHLIQLSRFTQLG